MNQPRLRTWNINLILAAVTLAAFLLALMLGTVDVPFTTTLKVLAHRIFGRGETEALKAASQIIVDIRLPRALTAAVVGAALAVSGAAMQGLLKNPLADGSIIGISSGGSLGAVLFLAFGQLLPFSLPGYGVAIASILFSFLSLLLVLTLAWRFDRGFVTNTIILLGVVFSMLAGSLTSLVIYFSGESKIGSVLHWMMGSLGASSYDKLIWLAPASLAGILFIITRADELNAFALGEEQAGYIGVNTKAVKLQVMVAVSVLIGMAVAVSGVIGFVGLIPPHIVRLLTGSNYRKLLPATALFGASFLILADLLSRTVTSLGIPIGVVTSLTGSLLFIYLFNSMRKKAA